MATFCKSAGLLCSLLALCIAAQIVWRQKPKKRWIILAVSLPILYVLSSGPLSWLFFVLGRPAWLEPAVSIYGAPLRWAMQNGPDWIADAVGCYVAWWNDAVYLGDGAMRARH